MQQSTLTITFARPESGVTSAQADLQLALDAEYNQKIYGEARSSFSPGETAYLRLVSNASDLYEIKTSSGSARCIAKNILYPISQTLAFAMADKATLSYLPASEIAHQWLGNDLGTPLFSGKNVSIAKAGVGLLKCDFKVSGDRLAVLTYNDVNVLVVVIQNGKVASLIVNYSKEKEDKTPTPYQLEVLDLCTDLQIDGVAVYLDGKKIGTTNENGIISLGNLIPGKTYALKMAHESYQDSDKDVLFNDSFTVPSKKSA